VSPGAKIEHGASRRAEVREFLARNENAWTGTPLRVPFHEGPRQGIGEMSEEKAHAHESGQLLHLVFGGELTDINGTEFSDPGKIDVVGVFPNYESAAKAWRAKAQATVDSAHTRYFIVHRRRFLEPAGLHRRP
jgi:hypothetical protein